MSLKIVKYGDPVLQKEGEAVTNIDGELAKFVADMFDTMYQAKGVGLAAPQVALSKKLFVMDVSNAKERQARRHQSANRRNQRQHRQRRRLSKLPRHLL
jgi:peptide deformylase